MAKGTFLHPLIQPEGLANPPVVFFEDFLQGPEPSSTADAASFLMSGTSAATAFANDERNGVITAVSNSTNPLSLQGNGEPFRLTSSNSIYFETRINLTDHDGMSWFAGLAITDTSVWSGALTDYVGFFGANEVNINYGTGKDNDAVPGSGTTGETDADSGKDAADDTWMILSFRTVGTSQVRFFVDGTFVGSSSSNLPDNEDLTATIDFLGSGETVDIDYVLVVGDRDIAT